MSVDAQVCRLGIIVYKLLSIVADGSRPVDPAAKPSSGADITEDRSKRLSVRDRMAHFQN
jgi:hypothetical protein